MKEVILGQSGKLEFNEAPLYKSLPNDITKWNSDIGKVLDILSNYGDISKIKLRHTLVLEEYFVQKGIPFTIVRGELLDGDSIMEIKMKYIDQIKSLLVVGEDLECVDIVFYNGKKSSKAICNAGKKKELFYLFNGPL